MEFLQRRASLRRVNRRSASPNQTLETVAESDSCDCSLYDQSSQSAGSGTHYQDKHADNAFDDNDDV